MPLFLLLMLATLSYHFAVQCASTLVCSCRRILVECVSHLAVGSAIEANLENLHTCTCKHSMAGT